MSNVSNLLEELKELPKGTAYEHYTTYTMGDVLYQRLLAALERLEDWDELGSFERVSRIIKDADEGKLVPTHLDIKRGDTLYYVSGTQSVEPEVVKGVTSVADNTLQGVAVVTLARDGIHTAYTFSDFVKRNIFIDEDEAKAELKYRQQHKED